METGKKRVKREKSAGAVIFKRGGGKDYYLLLHYTSGHWDFPKGHIEKGETEKETVLREVREETGIKNIKLIEGPKERINYFFRRTYRNKKRAPLVSKEVVFFLAESKTRKVKISHEHIDSEWLPYNKAIKKVTFKNAKEILKKANDFLKKTDND